MIKTYISTLLVVLMAVTQGANAQDDIDSMFGSMGAGDDTAGEMMDSGAMISDSDVAPAEVVDEEQVPAVDDSEMLSMLLKQGEAQYKEGEYAAAIRTFDAMLAIDKYNTTAIKRRERASKRISAMETKKQEVTRAEAMTDVSEAWNQEVKTLGTVLIE
jgi:hypothetical protein